MVAGTELAALDDNLNVDRRQVSRNNNTSDVIPFYTIYTT